MCSSGAGCQRIDSASKRVAGLHFSNVVRNAQSSDFMHGLQSAVYKVAERVVLDLLRRAVIGETLDEHSAKRFGSNDAADGVSRWLLTSK